MDMFNTPTILELRYDTAEEQHCVFTGKSYIVSKNMPRHVATMLLELVETQNYIGAITYCIRTDEINYMEMELETMLQLDGEQYPDPITILERVKRALGNLQSPKQLKIVANETSVSVILDKKS